jgi:hypothetical protein
MVSSPRAKNILIFLVLFLSLQLVSCSSHNAPSAATQQPSTTITATSTPFQPLTSITPPPTDPSPSATPQPTQPYLGDPRTLWIDPAVPNILLENLALPSDWQRSAQPDIASVKVVISDADPIAYRVYALVAPFPTITDGVTHSQLLDFWQGQDSGPFNSVPLLLDEETLTAFTALWGEPAEDSVRVTTTDEILSRAWKQMPSWGIVPFEELQPRWKVLQIDGAAPVQKDFDLKTYSLSLPISFTGDPQQVDDLLALSGPGTENPLLPPTNRDPSKMTVLAMTGTTALVRATAYTMELNGINYPAQDIGDLLRSADLTHISNEVAFASSCPYPNPNSASLTFCSKPSYIELLETVGTDIIELTGDHFTDWGTQPMYDTLEMYKQRGWLYYGGGADIADAEKPITIENNGNRLAFIGCNRKGQGLAWDNRPGAAPCDFPYIESQLQSLRDQGYLPIMTFQHGEYDMYAPAPNQEEDFRFMADAGAVIVSGSQAHQPQGMEFHNGVFIHYGLGNTFFDQYLMGLPHRQGFIDLHVFYDNRYISTQLVTIMFVDFARPRLMDDAERADLLNSAFAVSIW